MAGIVRSKLLPAEMLEVDDAGVCTLSSKATSGTYVAKGNMVMELDLT